jgi:formylglycine-generating enzyme required for sulfatase activity
MYRKNKIFIGHYVLSKKGDIMRFISKKVIIISLTLIFSLYEQTFADLNDGLVAYYPFKGNANDESGNGFNGLITGATLIADRFGNEDSAYFFDGIDDYIEIPDNENIDFFAGNFSICFWVKKLENSLDWDNCPGVQKWNNGSIPGTNEWSIGLCAGGSKNYPSFGFENNKADYRISSSEEIVVNYWYHLVGLRKDNQIMLYVNGKLKNSKDVGKISVNNFDSNLLIGKNTSLNIFTKAIFDDIRIYNRDLFEPEIRELYGLPNDSLICDINGDDKTGLEEAIHALKIATNFMYEPTEPHKAWTNDFGMTFVLIQPGTFVMGSPEGETGRGFDEVQYSVTLTQSYYFQTTEVTQGQWKAVMEINPSHFSSCGDNCPVENVSWEDAQVFIEKLNLHENTNLYHLPTEAQWEYAARAGSNTALANGNLVETDCNLDSNLNAMGWYCGNSDSKTHSVAQKIANAWGLYDMHGNVAEWCSDWAGVYPYISATDPRGPCSGSYRVIRGSAWNYYAQYCRSAGRYGVSPETSSKDIGLRLSRSLKP